MLSRIEFRKLCEAELGRPYIWGGNGPDSYDCSGLVQSLLAHLNLDPPGDQSAAGLYKHFMKERHSQSVGLADSELADLVFYGQNEAVTHVALAWGDQQMIEAGGGGMDTTTPEKARSKGAEVRIRPITRRSDRVAILRPLALAWAPDATHYYTSNIGSYGRFEGALLTEWLPNGRHMRLKLPYTYIAQNGTQWPVPADTIVDGASIPRPFWSVIGGPFEGLYRNASVVHDFYCVSQNRTWQSTHRMFYEAMRCSGVEEGKAKIMYYAVYRFGPRWQGGTSSLLRLPFEHIELQLPASMPIPAQRFDPGSASVDLALIVEENFSLDAIDALVDSRNGS
ncbi:DUF1353 domain-containing protein [Pseudomonas sp. CAU 1711]|uniref:DUF1353 domain-containing protein n=1 Tax=Pseudomonas sp. CAU 1711 TaxID=3140356 RepID=UPI0032603D9D